MITIKNPMQIEKMRRAGALLHQVLTALRESVKPGVTTLDLDAKAVRMILDAGAIPSFKDYNGYPMNICASVDDQVVHGIPNDIPLKSGQIVSIDAGLVLDGWQADSAFTSPVGEVKDEISQLIRVTEECFWVGVQYAKVGNRLGDISHAIQVHAEKHGYGVIRDLCGHGIGRNMHEDPDIPNFGPANTGVRLREGMTLAIEPMIALGDWPVYQATDGWTIITKDHSPCSHYEHTIAITAGDPEIMTFPGVSLQEVGP